MKATYILFRTLLDSTISLVLLSAHYGYDCQILSYTTEDGYINTLHRISPPQSNWNKTMQAGEKKRKVVFLQHGLEGTSADYVMGCPEKSLGMT